MNLRRLAIHEAGHAVAAFALRRRVRSVTIVPDGKYLGCCFLGSNGRYELYMAWFNDRMRVKLEREVVIYFAGCVAEKLHDGRYPRGYRRCLDAAHATELCGYVTRDDRAYLRWPWLRTHEFIADQRRWAAVLAVADALLEHGTLGGRRAREIYKEAILPPF